MNAPCLFLQRLGVDNLNIGKPTMRDIAEMVAERCGLTLADLRGPDRSQRISVPRQEAMALCYKVGQWSNARIGNYFGGRDHTTVIHARVRHEMRLEAARKARAA